MSMQPKVSPTLALVCTSCVCAGCRHRTLDRTLASPECDEQATCEVQSRHRDPGLSSSQELSRTQGEVDRPPTCLSESSECSKVLGETDEEEEKHCTLPSPLCSSPTATDQQGSLPSYGDSLQQHTTVSTSVEVSAETLQILSARGPFSCATHSQTGQQPLVSSLSRPLSPAPPNAISPSLCLTHQEQRLHFFDRRLQRSEEQMDGVKDHWTEISTQNYRRCPGHNDSNSNGGSRLLHILDNGGHGHTQHQRWPACSRDLQTVTYDKNRSNTKPCIGCTENTSQKNRAIAAKNKFPLPSIHACRRRKTSGSASEGLEEALQSSIQESKGAPPVRLCSSLLAISIRDLDSSTANRKATHDNLLYNDPKGSTGRNAQRLRLHSAEWCTKDADWTTRQTSLQNLQRQVQPLHQEPPTSVIVTPFAPSPTLISALQEKDSSILPVVATNYPAAKISVSIPCTKIPRHALESNMKSSLPGCLDKVHLSPKENAVLTSIYFQESLDRDSTKLDIKEPLEASSAENFSKSKASSPPKILFLNMNETMPLPFAKKHKPDTGYSPSRPDHQVHRVYSDYSLKPVHDASPFDIPTHSRQGLSCTGKRLFEIYNSSDQLHSDDDGITPVFKRRALVPSLTEKWFTHTCGKSTLPDCHRIFKFGTENYYTAPTIATLAPEMNTFRMTHPTCESTHLTFSLSKGVDYLKVLDSRAPPRRKHHTRRTSFLQKQSFHLQLQPDFCFAVLPSSPGQSTAQKIDSYSHGNTTKSPYPIAQCTKSMASTVSVAHAQDSALRIVCELDPPFSVPHVDHDSLMERNTMTSNPTIWRHESPTSWFSLGGTIEGAGWSPHYQSSSPNVLDTVEAVDCEDFERLHDQTGINNHAMGGSHYSTHSSNWQEIGQQHGSRSQQQQQQRSANEHRQSQPTVHLSESTSRQTSTPQLYQSGGPNQDEDLVPPQMLLGGVPMSRTIRTLPEEPQLNEPIAFQIRRIQREQILSLQQQFEEQQRQRRQLSEQLLENPLLPSNRTDTVPIEPLISIEGAALVAGIPQPLITLPLPQPRFLPVAMERSSGRRGSNQAGLNDRPGLPMEATTQRQPIESGVLDGINVILSSMTAVAAAIPVSMDRTSSQPPFSGTPSPLNNDRISSSIFSSLDPRAWSTRYSPQPSELDDPLMTQEGVQPPLQQFPTSDQERELASIADAGVTLTNEDHSQSQPRPSNSLYENYEGGTLRPEEKWRRGEREMIGR